MNFADNYARAVITVGIPYPNSKDVQVKFKQEYNNMYRVSWGLLSGSEWYDIQAFRPWGDVSDTGTTGACYYYYYSGYMCYYYYTYTSTETSVGTIIGAIVGGIVGLIVLCVISVGVCIVCCKKKTTAGTIIHPTGVTTVTSNSAPYNAHPSYHQQQQQGWGVQSSALYSGQQQPYPPPPVSKPLPPPTYAENVIAGQPPQQTN